ncbi:MAG: DUF6338 family protein [Erythrobacter sp.]|jgi:hypothetical protein|uniref:DUF6338 family protein n=1 Tax=Qipengyuania pacifica TaxID=2860199 RepID=UPI0035C7A8C0|nr:DUF6338 family protein [Erythrobacter sp.]
MLNFPSAKDITELAMLLAPGLIILGIRARFKEGAVPNLKDRAIAYAVTSTAYYAVVGPLFQVDAGVALSSWVWAWLHYVLVPLAIASLIVLFDQREWFYRLAHYFGFRLAHHIPAAWDYAFSKLNRGTFVWVKLNSGTEYAGKMGARSFASSSTAERDLYLEEVWQINEGDEPWTRMEPPRGVLLCGRDIQRIEIF